MIENNFPDYIIDTEFLTKEELNSVFLEISQAPFNFDPNNTIGTSEDGITGITGDRFFDRLIMISGNNHLHIPDQLRPMAKMLVEKFCLKHGFKLLEIYRTRTNMTFMSNDPRPTMPHVDLRGKEKHYIFLFFVNDSDGDTIMFDLKADGHPHTQEELLEKKRFSPGAGHAVIFDGDYFHTWEHPKHHDYRLSMVVNISIEKI